MFIESVYSTKIVKLNKRLLVLFYEVNVIWRTYKNTVLNRALQYPLNTASLGEMLCNVLKTMLLTFYVLRLW